LAFSAAAFLMIDLPIIDLAISLFGFGCPVNSVFKSLYSNSFLGFVKSDFNSFNLFVFF
jgi:hypothetical protein